MKKRNVKGTLNPAIEPVRISTKELCDLALYLSGVRDGKGSLEPLGNIHLENLYNTIAYLRGDDRFKAARDG